jgi:hypothetical protein
MVDESGTARRIYCRRSAFHPSGGKHGADGGASFPVDSLDAPAPIHKPAPSKTHQVERAAVEHVDSIYTVLLRAKLELSDEHRQNLLGRGLTRREIGDQGYCSTPTRTDGDLIAREMGDLGLAGVPGFFSSDGRVWKLAAMTPGILIPYRDRRGRIRGLQYRRDDCSDGRGKYIWLSSNPASSNFPRGTKLESALHFARPHLLQDAREVMLTEGALKAQIASLYLNSPLIASAGVHHFKPEFPAWLKTTYPKIETVRVTFDLDWKSNPDVRRAAFRLTERLQAAGFNVRLRVWPPELGKGIDDAVVTFANSRRLEVAA